MLCNACCTWRTVSRSMLDAPCIDDAEDEPMPPRFMLDEVELELSPRFMLEEGDPDVLPELLPVLLCANTDPDASAIQHSAAAIGVRYVFICFAPLGLGSYLAEGSADCADSRRDPARAIPDPRSSPHGKVPRFFFFMSSV